MFLDEFTLPFIITFLDGAVRNLNNLLDENSCISWFFDDRSDKELAEEIGRLIYFYVDENRGLTS